MSTRTGSRMVILGFDKKRIRASARAGTLTSETFRFVVDLQQHEPFRNFFVVSNNPVALRRLKQERISTVLRRKDMKMASVGRALFIVLGLVNHAALIENRTCCCLMTIFPFRTFA